MKVVILAGGKGTRLSEETQLRPKPLVEAQGRPLLWHVMQNYYRFGFNEFIILAGYKGHQLREYFANYWLHNSDVTFDLNNQNQKILNRRGLPWKVTICDTGVDTATGGRILRVKELLKEDFLLTYGDGVSDVDISSLIAQHKLNSSLVTLTAVQPPARFGALHLDGCKVLNFVEKPDGEGSWVNGGFFVMNANVFDYIKSDNASFEIDVLPRIALDGKLGAFKHYGYWQPVDTIRDLQRLDESLSIGKLPWK
jgi:glucose-1-phosphate cytidylyltransferase